jgi:hypothetical protein
MSARATPTSLGWGEMSWSDLTPGGSPRAPRRCLHRADELGMELRPPATRHGDEADAERSWARCSARYARPSCSRAGIPDPGGADNNFTRFLADHRTSRRCRMPTSRARPPWPPSSSRWPPSSPGCTAPWAPTRMEPPATGTISLIRQSKERDGDIEYIALCEKKTLIMGTDGYW